MSTAAVFHILRRMAELEAIVSRQQVRINNMLREGKVLDVDYDKGLATVEAHGIETKEIPWLQQAGDISEWTPISKDQRVLVFSPNGDLSRAVIMPGGYTDDNPAPHDKGAEKRVKIGGAVITHSAKGFFIEVDGTEYQFTGEGFIQTGGKKEHDGVNVGKDHKHTEVFPGDALTGPPAG